MTLFDKIRKLNFPIGKYLVVGGTMEVFGIRPAKDIDIIVTTDFFKELVSKGWKICECEWCLVTPRKMVKGDGVDVYSNYQYGNFKPKTGDLINQAHIIEGIPFARLETIVAFKKELGRPKDLKDIQLIEEFLATKF